MVESKNKTSAARAKIAHKLARYVRATPIHLTGIKGNNLPSASHLSISSPIQTSEEPPNADSEIKTIPGTPLTMKNPDTRELPINQNPPKAENPSPPALSSF